MSVKNDSSWWEEKWADDVLRILSEMETILHLTQLPSATPKGVVEVPWVLDACVKRLRGDNPK